MKGLIRHLKIWWVMSKNSFMMVSFQKAGVSIFLLGKILRFSFFLAFLFFLLKSVNSLAGYNINQTIFFFLTFNLIDVLGQFLFREVYRFRQYLVTGDFDLVLVKPMNALFRSLLGGADVIDLITIPPLVLAAYYVGSLLNPTFPQVIFYLLLLLNGLLISAAFHIAVLALGIITFEIDHTVMIFRDLSALGRLPVDIYKEPLRGMLTFLIPVGVMITLPAKTLMGLVSPQVMALAFFVGGFAFFVALRFWNLALKKYTSASS